ncbi:ABC transporter ATP-binding protein [Janibacter sp. DB-40]|uniref:ABC transporter ATP-binding protein n=1 Tax=Janibacter sp. DB-40 TaxID=3028808 RepID=UPI0024053553|nr:ABC transporter ATP-binding protein [Janibacter sp. DB-40]
MGNYVIEIAGLTVTRGGRLVLPGLDLRVPAGQVVGLLGPSGGGKSTVMRAVVGVQRIDGGDVEVLGLPAGHRRLRKRVGYVTQSPSVYGDLTVRENVTHFARLLGVADPAATAEAVVARVGLTEHADDRTDELSGGQRSRASLAAALVGDPELLVLDEPTVGLDPVLRRDLWSLFRRLAEDGVTLLVSSHVMDEASRCDRLVLLREGVVLADDTPARLLEHTGAEDAEGAFLALVEGAAA